MVRSNNKSAQMALAGNMEDIKRNTLIISIRLVFMQTSKN